MEVGVRMRARKVKTPVREKEKAKNSSVTCTTSRLHLYKASLIIPLLLSKYYIRKK